MKDKKIKLYRESLKERKERVNNSRSTYSKVITPNKGKGAYSRKRKNNIKYE